MDLAKAHALISRLSDAGDFVLYGGKFMDEHAPALIALCEGLAAAHGRGKAQAHRLSFVLIEAYQNILRHRAQLTGAQNRSLLVLQARDSADAVLSMDPVHDAEAAQIEHAIRDIAASDLAQLKQRFLARLRDGSRTARGGAGLGLIEIARKSGGGLIMDRWKVSEEHSMVLIQAIMGGGRSHAWPVEEARAAHEGAADLDATFAFRCGASPSADSAALRIMIGECDSPALSMAFHAAGEWFASMPSLGPCYLLLAGNGPSARLVLALKGEWSALGDALDRVNAVTALTRSELEARHREALLGRGAGMSFGAALLELARLANGPGQAAVLGVERDGLFIWSLPLAGR